MTRLIQKAPPQGEPHENMAYKLGSERKPAPILLVIMTKQNLPTHCQLMEKVTGYQKATLGQKDGQPIGAGS